MNNLKFSSNHINSLFAILFLENVCALEMEATSKAGKLRETFVVSIYKFLFGLR
jgi:hypothetical protein